MRLDQWRGLLNVDAMKSRDDEDFWAICPVHNDHEASLHVYVAGDGQIVMKCHACGADRKAVAEKLGYTLKDVAVDARSGEPPARYAGALNGSRPRKGKRVRLYSEGDVWQLPREKDAEGKPVRVPFTVTRVYEYKTTDGRVVLRKARLERFDEAGRRIEKSFAVQSLTEDGAWVNNDGAYGGLLYHADELAAAVRDGGRILLCEGEKDCDNLRLLGYTATTAQHGAGNGRNMKGKWSEAQTGAMLGASSVVLMPDNDQVGEQFMQYVASCLHEAGQRCQIVQVKDAWPDCPPKGDFTDWAQAMKSEGVGRQELVRRLETLIAQAPDWNPDGVPVYTVPATAPAPASQKAQPAAPSGDGGGKDGEDPGEPYYGLNNYSVKWDKLCVVNKDGPHVIADFVPRPRQVVVSTDGQTESIEFVIGGDYRGKPMKDARIAGAAELMRMVWPSQTWGFRGRLAMGARAAAQVYDAIMRAGQKAATWTTIYNNTGMMTIDGRPAYLYNGGAIGAEGVSVELRNNLRYYDLAETGTDAAEGARATWALAAAFQDRIVLPLLAQAYLAPVYSVLEGMDMPPSYVVFVAGETGAYKSSLVSYVMAHFGRFYNRRFPATFEDTANSARDKTFIVKDALYVIDDYNPQNDRRAMTRMDGVANSVITAIADRAERGGLTAGKELREERPARCTCIMTGEQLPNLGQGRVLRLYVINVSPGDIADSSEALRPFADLATRGVYRASMRGYIERLLARWDGIRQEIGARLDRCQQVADAFLDKRWARMGHAAGCLLLGCDLMIEHMQAMGVIAPGPEAYQQEIMRCWRAIEANIRAQTAAVEEATPARQWIAALRSLVRTSAVSFSDLLVTEKVDSALPHKVGWNDGHYYYLDPSAADREIRQLWKDSGQDVGMSNAQIHRQLMEMGLVLPGQEKDGKRTPGRPKSIGGKTKRVLWVARALVDRDEGEEDYAPVDDDAPF